MILLNYFAQFVFIEKQPTKNHYSSLVLFSMMRRLKVYCSCGLKPTRTETPFNPIDGHRNFFRWASMAIDGI